MSVEVYEQFVSWQGEGPDTGRRAMFYRFAGCDIRCFWCDSKFAQDFSSNLQIADLERVFREKIWLTVVTGGEPLHPLNLVKVKRLISELRDRGYNGKIEVETSGKFRYPGIEGVLYVVSPKPWFVRGADFVYGVDRSWFDVVDGVVFKVVISKEYGFDFYRGMLSDFLLKHGLDGDRIWLMPKGVSVKEVLENGKLAITLAEEFGTNICSRLQILYRVR